MGCPHNHGCPALLTVRPKSAGNEGMYQVPACPYRRPGPPASTGSNIDVSSFSGLFTRVLIGHIFMAAAGNGTSSPWGLEVESGEPVII